MTQSAKLMNATRPLFPGVVLPLHFVRERRMGDMCMSALELADVFFFSPSPPSPNSPSFPLHLSIIIQGLTPAQDSFLYMCSWHSVYFDICASDYGGQVEALVGSGAGFAYLLRARLFSWVCASCL